MTAAPTDDELVSVPLVAAAAEISYRQLHHWLQQMYVSCVGDPQPGSGARIYLTREQAYVVRIMARLVNAGVRPAQAAPLAHKLAQDSSTEISDDIVVTLTGTLASTS